MFLIEIDFKPDRLEEEKIKTTQIGPYLPHIGHKI